MAVNVEEIVGAANMAADRKNEAIAAIRDTPTDLTTKKYLLGRWARVVNVVLTNADFEGLA